MNRCCDRLEAFHDHLKGNQAEGDDFADWSIEQLWTDFDGRGLAQVCSLLMVLGCIVYGWAHPIPTTKLWLELQSRFFLSVAVMCEWSFWIDRQKSMFAECARNVAVLFVSLVFALVDPHNMSVISAKPMPLVKVAVCFLVPSIIVVVVRFVCNVTCITGSWVVGWLLVLFSALVGSHHMTEDKKVVVWFVHWSMDASAWNASIACLLAVVLILPCVICITRSRTRNDEMVTSALLLVIVAHSLRAHIWCGIIVLLALVCVLVRSMNFKSTQRSDALYAWIGEQCKVDSWLNRVRSAWVFIFYCLMFFVLATMLLHTSLLPGVPEFAIAVFVAWFVLPILIVPLPPVSSLSKPKTW